MSKQQGQTNGMIEALREGLHGLHLARMALVGEALALRLAGRRAEREKVWARVEELTAQIEVSNRELAEHMMRAETQRRGDADDAAAKRCMIRYGERDKYLRVEWRGRLTGARIVMDWADMGECFGLARSDAAAILKAYAAITGDDMAIIEEAQ